MLSTTVQSKYSSNTSGLCYIYLLNEHHERIIFVLNSFKSKTDLNIGTFAPSYVNQIIFIITYV